MSVPILTALLKLNLPLIQSRIVHSSLAYCALLRTVYCVLCNTDRFTNFITVKYVTI